VNTIPTITINMDKECAECGKGGAADSGICLHCTSRAITGRVMKSQEAKAVQQHFFSLKEKLRSNSNG